MIERLYFEWLCSFVYDEPWMNPPAYTMLLAYLFDTEFTYTLPMDNSRYEDGINFRYKFGDDNDIDDRVIATEIDIRPCSVLEMMVALAYRCEDSIMVISEYGVKPGRWFWGMIESLGLDKMTDENFDQDYVGDVIQRFLDRKYSPNGKGGLFTIYGIQKDLRNVDIWYQMMWYLTSLTKE